MIKSNHKSRKNRVLFIVASLARAGAETQLINLANSLDNKKFDKLFFTFHKNLDQYQKLDHEKIRFYNVPRKNKFDFSIARKIANIINIQKIDAVHCTGLFSLLIGWLSFRLAKNSPHLIAAIHTTLHSSFKGEFFEKVIFQWLLRGCDHVIFVSKKQAEYWKTKYHFLVKKSIVIHNGVDISYFHPTDFQKQGKELKRRLSISDSAQVVCCIAGFRREKGHEDLIEAFTRTKYKDKLYLLLAGAGPRKKHVELLVKNRGLEKYVKFLGNVSDVRPVLAASDISVLASTAVETFSMAMLESMSMGVPVVATDIGGLSEAIIPGETGELVPIGDPAMLARTISRVISDKARHAVMQKKCRELIAHNFTTEKMVSATARILSSIHVES